MPLFRKKSDKKSLAVSAASKHKRTPSAASNQSVGSDVVLNGELGISEFGGPTRPKTLLLDTQTISDDDPDILKPQTPLQTSSRLSKTLLEILHDKDALPYFIQFMGSKKADALIKFWLDAESFQASSWTRIRSHSQASACRKSSVGRAKDVEGKAQEGGQVQSGSSSPSAASQDPSNSDQSVNAVQQCSDNDNVQSSNSQSTKTADSLANSSSSNMAHNRLKEDDGPLQGATPNITENDNCKVNTNDTGCSADTKDLNNTSASHPGSHQSAAPLPELDHSERCPLDSNLCASQPESVAKSTDPAGSEPVVGTFPNGARTENSNAHSLNSSSVSENTGSTESAVDSPAERAGQSDGATKQMPQTTPTDTYTTSGPADTTEEAPVLDTEDEDALQEKLRKSIEQDAVNIYTKYISHDAPCPIPISDELRSETITKICKEDGQVDPQCFILCQDYVVDVMEKDYYPGFIGSEFHCKHQIDILTGSKVYLADILYNDTAMFYFMEFMEQEHAASLLRFGIAVDNWEQQLALQGDADPVQTQGDAMILYDKFFSLQASEPLGFEDKVRFTVEENICREGGPLPDCFSLPKKILMKTLQKSYFEQFMKSDLYFKYLNELINTVQAHDMPTLRRKRAGSDASSEHSAGSQSTGSDLVSSKNTLLAASSGSNLKKAVNKIEDDMHMDPVLFNPDALWKRKDAGNMTMGKINEVGQFVSGFDPDPDHEKKKKGTFFKRKKEKNKAQEDMALQIAQMIISDVKAVTEQTSSPGSPESQAGSQASQASLS